MRVRLELDHVAAKFLLAHVNRRLLYSRKLSESDRALLIHAQQALALGLELSTREPVIPKTVHSLGGDTDVESAPV